jgi:hypothetical protein
MRVEGPYLAVWDHTFPGYLRVLIIADSHLIHMSIECTCTN